MVIYDEGFFCQLKWMNANQGKPEENVTINYRQRSNDTSWEDNCLNHDYAITVVNYVECLLLQLINRLII